MKNLELNRYVISEIATNIRRNLKHFVEFSELEIYNDEHSRLFDLITQTNDLAHQIEMICHNE